MAARSRRWASAAGGFIGRSSAPAFRDNADGTPRPCKTGRRRQSRWRWGGDIFWRLPNAPSRLVQGGLFRCMEENHRSILRSYIRPLAVLLGWIVQVPKDVEQLRVGYLCRVEPKRDDLGMARIAGADLPIGWVRPGPAHKADGGINHAGHAPECRLDAPKTTRAKGGLLHLCLLLRARLFVRLHQAHRREHRQPSECSVPTAHPC